MLNAKYKIIGNRLYNLKNKEYIKRERGVSTAFNFLGFKAFSL